MGYIVPFLTISSILIDVCINNVIFIGAIFNSYNYWYLLSYSNQFTLHYSILFLIISINIIPLIYCYFRYYFQIKFSLELLKAIRSSYITLLFNHYSLRSIYLITRFSLIYSNYPILSAFGLLSFNLLFLLFFNRIKVINNTFK